jgi:hypothetical protein
MRELWMEPGEVGARARAAIGVETLPTATTGKPAPDSAAWWKAVAQGLARKLWPTREAPHPEDTCQVCRGPNIVWSAPNHVWNRVMPDDGGILCPVCFVIAAESAGIVTVWRLTPET